MKVFVCRFPSKKAERPHGWTPRSRPSKPAATRPAPGPRRGPHRASRGRDASAFLTKAIGSTERGYLTEGIVYEFLRVATHPKVFSAPLSAREALSFTGALTGSQAFEVLVAGERHWQTLGEVVAALRHPSGNLFFDIRTVALMREHGVREIYTADADFKLFAGIKVLNPIRD